ncbi:MULTISPECIES: HAD-IIB family hydrolase [Desulfococcus]|jgi:sucrose-phosphate synthase|uniref:sucrose-phosphate synthase n=1 Tax=Desulfococcus multivorans DSM 2059 TaxID=1121405 RepID=S7V5D2_DESML|nr:HAD-IIB family hydrolase [Desulfococcus multivorans]AOY56849.1 sucrose-phosphate synthase [Desulfococcus multivorans]AQU99392.1 glycosyl transferase family 1 [Desulfococcus multivorans]EPR41864.1 sucrose-phosphate synthase [Desulfococcus multivorans DSM 2059]MDX9818775.1 HAD-IIB family hydrolase [Desulfococcus multivorans]SJZ93260.1 sucrose-phosphate synthase [Desulfococcus multivorans DSM 2059]
MSQGLYFQLFSIHGLLRHEAMELGRDADTGGQIKYVVELAETLSRHKKVAQVDLFTRLIADKRVSADYSQPVTQVSDKCRIVRIQCGGKKYMRKELLWPHLDEYIDKTIQFIKREGRHPDIVHGHYPDAGYVAITLSEYFGTPLIYTGHSLGHPKKKRLLNEGMRPEEIQKKLFIDHRIAVEEEILRNADLVVTSTSQEVEQQYGMYRNRDLARYAVIPPGINLEHFYPYYRNMLPSVQRKEESLMAYGGVMEELNRFFIFPDKPLILALCRADKRKNIAGLIKAYGTDRDLQAMANLAIFAGIRKNIQEMGENEKEVLTDMLLQMDRYDLYGKMAIPKKHDFTYEVPELYRITAERKGVFVNCALVEPFGLTLIEASSCGVPIVATNDGGPRDIVRNCKNGILVDPKDVKAISNAIKRIIADHDLWRNFSDSGIKGVQQHYSWDAHVEKYLKRIEVFDRFGGREVFKRSAQNPVGERLIRLEFLVITDIDHTLMGDDAALHELLDLLETHKDRIGFGVATGRSITSTQALFERKGLALPEILITSVGSEIYYRSDAFTDKGWQRHISKWWDRKKIENLLTSLDFLELQEREHQLPFKLSYYMSPKNNRIAKINAILNHNKCHCTVIYSHDKYLDILPHRASKGKAVRYLSYKWDIPLQNIIVCGDSGNDQEMLVGSAMGVVVGNYAQELETLKGKRRIYFSPENYAAGIIDGLHHYGLISRS